jgi:sporulation protein YlmC with PRC-barrel domain
MRYKHWLVATAIGAGLSLSSVSGRAQLKTREKDDADATKAKALDVSGEVDVPNGKALGVKGTAGAPKAKGIVAGRAAVTAPADRHEVRRIPVIDANAGATFRSTQLIGTNITDADGNMIGKVVDFVSDARGNILFPIVSYSGSAGFTGKLFAIPPLGLTFNAGANNSTSAQFAFDPQLLKNAPSFSSTRFPDFSDQAFVNQIKSFFADILPGADRNVATDPTVPANGPGDRVSTQEKANTPTLPTDPTLPANGPGDRPATVNPALPRTAAPSPSTTSTKIPGTTGTENAGFPPVLGVAGTEATSSAGTSIPGGTVDGSTGAPVSSSATSSVRTVDTAGSFANNSIMLRTSQMVGMSIQDSQGQTIGKVVDLVGDGSGAPRFAIASLGDGRNIVLPATALRFQAGANGSNIATLRVALGQLKNAPSFTGTDFPDFSSRQFLTSMERFYSPLLPSIATPTGPTTPGGSTPTTAGTRTPDWPSRPIPPGGPVPRPGPDGKFPTTTTPSTTTGSTTPTGPTTPGGSRSTPGGTRTPDWPSRPIPPGGPVPRPGPGGTFPKTTPPMVGPRIPAPGARAPGVPGVPSLPGAAPAHGGAAPAGGGTPSGGASGGGGARASGT